MIGKLSTWYKENVSESADCWACRLTSGFGMMGIGAFLLVQAKRRNKPFENYTMKSLAAAAGFLGAARLADANFLKPAQTENKIPTGSRKIEDPLAPYARR